MSERLSIDGKQKAELVKQIHEKARTNIEEKTKQYAKHANKSRHELIFEEGDLVWVHLRKERFPAQRKSKLMPRVDGPFKITRKISDNAYKIDLQGKYNISDSFNVSDLAPFLADDPDLRSNPFQEEGDDMIMEDIHDMELEPSDGQEAKEHEPEQIVAEESMCIPTGPITRAMARRLKTSVTGLLQLFYDQASNLPQEEFTSTLVVIQVRND